MEFLNVITPEKAELLINAYEHQKRKAFLREQNGKTYLMVETPVFEVE